MKLMFFHISSLVSKYVKQYQTLDRNSAFRAVVLKRFRSWATFLFRNPSLATRINNLNKNSLKKYLKSLKC